MTGSRRQRWYGRARETVGVTAVADRPTDTPGPDAVAPATRRENLTVVALTLWLMAGLSLDGYAHVNILDVDPSGDGVTEDFFTPWHAIFYAAFTSLAAYIGLIAWRRQRPGSLASWIPPGYGLAVVGVGVFAVGGVGDGIWHTIFGVEIGIDALLSPTHLLLLLGGGMIVTAPIRARLAEGLGDEPSTWHRDGSTIGALTAVTAGLAFFLTFSWGLSFWWAPQVRFIDGDGGSEVLVARAVSAALVTSAALVIPPLWAHRHGLLPTGGVVVIWGLATLAESAALSQPTRSVPPALLGALVVEVVRRRLPTPVALVAGIGSMWTVWWLTIALDAEPFRWPAEIWAGHLGLTTLVTAWLVIGVSRFDRQPSSASS